MLLCGIELSLSGIALSLGGNELIGTGFELLTFRNRSIKLAVERDRVAQCDRCLQFGGLACPEQWLSKHA